MNKENQKGISLYIAFMIMTALLGVALGAGSILFSQLNTLRGLGHSTFAFFATEAGLENALYTANIICLDEEDQIACLSGNIPQGSVSLPNGASYVLEAESPGEGGCPGDPELNYTYCIRAEGSFEGAARAVRVAR